VVNEKRAAKSRTSLFTDIHRPSSKDKTLNNKTTNRNKLCKPTKTDEYQIEGRVKRQQGKKRAFNIHVHEPTTFRGLQGGACLVTGCVWAGKEIGTCSTTGVFSFFSFQLHQCSARLCVDVLNSPDN
jgi:hypothetical protein